jgi:hypothetical protein
VKIVAPSPSYEIPLPDDVIEEYDERVASYWRSGSHVLLQFSSATRSDGPQVAASQRLQDLFLRKPGDWEAFELGLPGFPGESAGAEMNDDQGIKWIHVYLTTPSISIYATIVGPPDELVASVWTFDAIRNLRIKQSL